MWSPGRAYGFKSHLLYAVCQCLTRQEQSGHCPVESKITLAGTLFPLDKLQNEVRRDFVMRSLLRKTKAGSSGIVYPFRQERRVFHKKAIIIGKLYDTEKAEFLCMFKDRRILLKTKSGNYFSCSQDIKSVSEEKMDEIGRAHV